MPSILRGLTTESVALDSSDSSPYDPPTQKLTEKSSRRSSNTGALTNGYPLDASTGSKRIIDGVFLSDATNQSLQSLPNGRSSGSTDSKERGWLRHDGTFSVINGMGNAGDKEKQSSGPVNGLANQAAVEQAKSPTSKNGEAALLGGQKTSENGQSGGNINRSGHTRAHSSSAPQHHIIQSSSSSQVDTAHPTSFDANQTAPPVNRFSSPANLPTSTATPAASSTSSLHAGPVRLQHRHTLQVPRLSTTSTSRDFSLPTTSISTDVVGETEKSPGTYGTARVSTSLGRRPTRSIHSEQYADEITQDDDMARWTETIRQKRASRRQRKEEEEDDRVVVGTKVDMNHVNWVTAYNMLTGIRFTVSRTNAKIDRDLTDADFDAKHKFSFDM